MIGRCRGCLPPDETLASAVAVLRDLMLRVVFCRVLRAHPGAMTKHRFGVHRRLEVRRLLGGAPRSYSRAAISFDSASGLVVGAWRDWTCPLRSTRNFEKFHLMALPSRPPFCCFSHT